jgi:hypothetical protein
MEISYNDPYVNLAWVRDSIADTTYTNNLLIQQAGTYWPIVTDCVEYCGTLDTIEVSYFPDPLELGPDTSGICITNPLVLDATIPGGSNYTWSTGDTVASITATDNGYYWVAVQDSNCTLHDTILLAYDDPLPVDLPDTVFLCDSLPIMLMAGDFPADFLWAPNGETTADIIINQPGLYSVTASNACGDFTDSTQAITLQSPTVNLGNDTTICLGESLLLSVPAQPLTSYLWSTGQTDTSISVATQGWYSLSVTNACGDATDTISLTVHENLFAFPFDSLLLPSGQAITIDAGPGFATYLWNTTDTTQTITAGNTGLYWVEVIDSIGCWASDTVLVVRLDNIAMPGPFDQIKIYPNPVSDELVIEFGGNLTSPKGYVSVALHNSLGQLVLFDPTEALAQSEGFGRISLDMSALPEGIYLLIIAQGAERKVFRVVKTQ